jgi:hypothetical protein
MNVERREASWDYGKKCVNYKMSCIVNGGGSEADKGLLYLSEAVPAEET